MSVSNTRLVWSSCIWCWPGNPHRWCHHYRHLRVWGLWGSWMIPPCRPHRTPPKYVVVLVVLYTVPSIVPINTIFRCKLECPTIFTSVTLTHCAHIMHPKHSCFEHKLVIRIYEWCLAVQNKLVNRSSMILSWKHCPGVSCHHQAWPNMSSGSLAPRPSPSLPAPCSFNPTLTRLSLHTSSKLSPSIWMIRLCKMMHMCAHMMMTMWHLVLMSWIQISLRDWKVPFSMPIVCSTCMCIYQQSNCVLKILHHLP